MGQAFGFGERNSQDPSSVQHLTFCDRLGKACIGVVVGLILFVISVPLLGWNEFNYVRNEKILLQVEKDVVSVKCSDAPNAQYDGKPVFVSCMVQKAFDFAISPDCPNFIENDNHKANSAWFKVDSVIYQFVEKTKSKTTKTGGGGETTETWYSYETEWVKEPVDSSKFYCTSKFQSDKDHCSGILSAASISNEGTIPDQLLSRRQVAPDYTVGIGGLPPNDATMYHLPKELTEQISSSRPPTINVKAPSPIPGRRLNETQGTVRFAKGDQDTVGDVQTIFALANILPGQSTLSVISLQQPNNKGPAAGKGKSFAPWQTGMKGTMSEVSWLSEGSLTKEQMINEKRNANSGALWMLRFAGFFAMLIGLQLITGPIALMPEAVPCIGNFLGEVVGCMLFVMNLCLSSALSLVIIGVAWLMARPLVGLIILLIAGIFIGIGFYVRSKSKIRAREIQVPLARFA